VTAEERRIAEVMGVKLPAEAPTPTQSPLLTALTAAISPGELGYAKLKAHELLADLASGKPAALSLLDDLAEAVGVSKVTARAMVAVAAKLAGIAPKTEPATLAGVRAESGSILIPLFPEEK
jgi:hypothetical protein